MTRDIVKGKNMYVEIYDKELHLGRKLNGVWEELSCPVWAAEAPQEELWVTTARPPTSFSLFKEGFLPLA